MLEPFQTWKRYWIATMPDGSQIPQFDPNTGDKFGWDKLPDKPIQIDLVAFSPELATKVQATGICAVYTTSKTIRATGEGLIALRDAYFAMGGGMKQYDTHYIVRFKCSGEIEIRETDERIEVHGRKGATS
jgi:hypothetical protein